MRGKTGRRARRKEGHCLGEIRERKKGKNEGKRRKGKKGKERRERTSQRKKGRDRSSRGLLGKGFTVCMAPTHTLTHLILLV